MTAPFILNHLSPFCLTFYAIILAYSSIHFGGQELLKYDFSYSSLFLSSFAPKDKAPSCSFFVLQHHVILPFPL